MRYCVASNESESVISSHMATCYVRYWYWWQGIFHTGFWPASFGDREYSTLGYGLVLGDRKFHTWSWPRSLVTGLNSTRGLVLGLW